MSEVKTKAMTNNKKKDIHASKQNTNHLKTEAVKTSSSNNWYNTITGLEIKIQTKWRGGMQ